MLVIISLAGIFSAFVFTKWLLSHEEEYKGFLIFPADKVTIVHILAAVLMIYFAFGIITDDIIEILRYSCFISLLLTVSYIDTRIKSIYDISLIVYGFLAIALSLIQGFDKFMFSVYGLISGFAIYSLVALIGLIIKLILKKDAFGFGDVLFLSALGIFLGWQKILIASILSFYVAFVWIVFLLIFKKYKKTMHIPFAPSIAIASYLVYIYGDEILKIALLYLRY